MFERHSIQCCLGHTRDPDGCGSISQWGRPRRGCAGSNLERCMIRGASLAVCMHRHEALTRLRILLRDGIWLGPRAADFCSPLRYRRAIFLDGADKVIDWSGRGIDYVILIIIAFQR